MKCLVLGVGLLAYNNLMNRWPPFNGPLYVPINLILAGLVVAIGLGPLGLSTDLIGLPINAAGLLVAVIVGAALTVPLFVLAGNGGGASLIADRRIAGLTGASLAYQVLVRVPLGTALVEEIAFRGVLLAGLRSAGDTFAAIGSSLCFGMWHIGPTLNLVSANRPGASRRVQVGAVLVAVTVTSGAGLVLAWLRLQTGDLGAPIGVHAGLNSLGTVAAVLANRKLA
jgi:uncharacterized protein